MAHALEAVGFHIRLEVPVFKGHPKRIVNMYHTKPFEEYIVAKILRRLMQRDWPELLKLQEALLVRHREGSESTEKDTNGN